MDSITLTGISAQGTHGVLESEKKRPQTFIVDAQLFLDLSAAGRDDDLAQTVDYGQIASRIVSVIHGSHCNLLETLATRIANAILQTSRIRSVIVTVHKPRAPITVPFKDVSVRIERSQPGTPTPDESAFADEAKATPSSPRLSASAPQKPVSPGSAASAAQNRQESRRKDSGPRSGNENAAKGTDVHHAVLSLGGNIGDVEEAMRQAIVSLDGIAGDQVSGISPLYRTTPWGMAPGTPDFLNCVIELDTLMDAHQLLTTIHLIEAAHGRSRKIHWGSRPLDIDIIDFDHEVSADPTLTLPHPRAWQRAFVLAPLADLEPDFVLPGTHGGPVATLLAACPDRDAVLNAGDDWILSAGQNNSNNPDDGRLSGNDPHHPPADGSFGIKPRPGKEE